MSTIASLTLRTRSVSDPAVPFRLLGDCLPTYGSCSTAPRMAFVRLR